MYRCPNCNSTELEVVVEVWARLTQTGEGDDFETDTTTLGDANHEWSDNSPMRCSVCYQQDIADAFQVPEAA